jgi:hypothetical protein
MMAGVVLLATVELALLIGKDVLTPPLFLLELDELLELFGQFLLVLIGIELMGFPFKAGRIARSMGYV